MRRALLSLGAIVLLLGLAAAGLVAFAWRDYVRPGPSTADVRLVLPKGAGVGAIAERLERAGVIRHALGFRLAARLTGAARQLRAGEYRFPAGLPMREAIGLLRRGDVVVRRLTIPEGLTTAEAIRLVAEADGLEGDPGPPPPEGALLPETYHYSWGDERAALVARMRQAMEETLAALWEKRPADYPLSSPAELVTLASIVEKETGVAAERPRVAAVFLNRLKRGMKLQSDPTVVYGLTHGQGPLGRELTRADLQAEHPYNTYLHAGLPPGPIANPGRASLEATLRPERTNALYFVADGAGGHAFAETLDEHNRNVSRWRKLRDAAE
jgi:UPF0755 protein